MTFKAAFTRRRVAAGVALVLSTGVCAAASHALADGGTTTPVTFGAETWFQPDPTCQLPTGCLSVGVTPPAVNPYGANTLHVSVSAGEETGRVYLALKATAIPAGDTITRAVFVAPLDTSNVGSAMPDTSTTQVCTSSATITATEGEFDDPPTTDCHTAFQALTYVAAPVAELTGDLTDLLNAHLSDLSAGTLDLAILPYMFAQTATWHDVFDSNDAGSTTTPTLTLTFGPPGTATAVGTTADPEPAATASTPTAATTSKSAPHAKPVAPVASPVSSTAAAVTGTVPVAAAPAAPVSVAAAPVGAGAASAAPAPRVAGSDQATSTDAPASAPQSVATVASTKTIGFAYPGVLLLPLVLIGGGVGLARVMTRDVAPKRPTAT